MVIVHSVLHGAIAILRDGQPVEAIRQHYVPFLAACSMILIVPAVVDKVILVRDARLVRLAVVISRTSCSQCCMAKLELEMLAR
ncbi:uncharacterized protein BJX67DRAFT_368616 [Aspergillus lucknowensis]|uniref:Uncharacterized protein n=1 Tax=Aspergillus lucknowensis TaxID=176173 RepID=A0ABR4L5R1_9EURO